MLKTAGLLRPHGSATGSDLCTLLSYIIEAISVFVKIGQEVCKCQTVDNTCLLSISIIGQRIDIPSILLYIHLSVLA